MRTFLTCLGLAIALAGCGGDGDVKGACADAAACRTGSDCCPGADTCCPDGQPGPASASGRLSSDAELLAFRLPQPGAEPGDGRTMTIRWQRLTDDQGETCDRCGATEAAVRNALARLRTVLEPYGLDVRLEASALDSETFRGAPGESNRIWIAGTPLEDLLEAKVGMSGCDSCGDLCGAESTCRTMTVAGTTYEAIPADLVVQAGLVAASRLVRDERPGLGLTYCVE